MLSFWGPAGVHYLQSTWNHFVTSKVSLRAVMPPSSASAWKPNHGTWDIYLHEWLIFYGFHGQVNTPSPLILENEDDMNSSFDKDHETMSCCALRLIGSPSIRFPVVLLPENSQTSDFLPHKIAGLAFHKIELYKLIHLNLKISSALTKVI